jgi:hypothetical protein
MAIDLEHPHLSDAEQGVLVHELGRTSAYFELGMGGSSLLAVRAGVPEIVMVDSDAAWVASVRQHPEIAPRVADRSVMPIHADIGPVREWGTPADQTHVQKWHTYLSVGWAEWARRATLPDLVFVDGRFRVACCFSIALVCMQQQPPGGMRVMMHDVNEERPHYLDVFEFFEEMDRVDSLIFMRPRSDTLAGSCISKLLGRQFDYG